MINLLLNTVTYFVIQTKPPRNKLSLKMTLTLTTVSLCGVYFPAKPKRVPFVPVAKLSCIPVSKFSLTFL